MFISDIQLFTLACKKYDYYLIRIQTDQGYDGYMGTFDKSVAFQAFGYADKIKEYPAFELNSLFRYLNPMSDLEFKAVGLLNYAMWDVLGHKTEKSVQQLLGGPVHDFIPLAGHIEDTELDLLKVKFVDALGKGYSIVQCVPPELSDDPVNCDGLVQLDEICCLMKNCVEKNTLWSLDFNNRFRFSWSLHFLKNIDRSYLQYISDPCFENDFEGSRRLNDIFSVPVFLSVDRADFRTTSLIDDYGGLYPKIFSIYPAGVNELQNILAYYDACYRRVVLKVEDPLSLAAAFQIGTTMSNVDYIEVSDDRYEAVRFAFSFSNPPADIKCLNNIGWGITPDLEKFVEVKK